MTGYVVREGKVRGHGLYAEPCSEGMCERLVDAGVWYNRGLAAKFAEEIGGRVVKLVPKRKPVRVTRAQVELATRSLFPITWRNADALNDVAAAFMAAGIEVKA